MSRGDPADIGDVEALVMEVVSVFYGLRTVGERHGLVSEQGVGYWGLLRLIQRQGPISMAEVARTRPVSRQYIQKMASALCVQGWVELRDNPADKRSKLMVLTKAGSAKLAAMNRQVRRLMTDLAPGFDSRELRDTQAVLSRLRQRLPVGEKA